MDKERRDQMHLEMDLTSVICKTFHEFAKGEPEQFNEPEEGWEYWAAYYRFGRASIIAVENILKEYEVKAI